MSTGVEGILEERRALRERRAERLRWWALGLAVGLHALALGAALVLPTLAEEPADLPDFATVRMVPLRALGTPDAPPEPSPAPALPEPSRPEPEPAAPKPAEPEPPPPDPTPAPSRQPAPRNPEPRREAETRPEPRREPAPSPAPGAAGEGAGRRGTPDGNPAGQSAFGARVGLDNPDFRYDAYLERMLSLIDAQWVRPATDGAVQATVHFRVEKDGRVSELTILEESGYNAFDLAALRAIRNASPLPPLPRGYRSDSLGVQLIVR